MTEWAIADAITGAAYVQITHEWSVEPPCGHVGLDDLGCGCRDQSCRHGRRCRASAASSSPQATTAQVPAEKQTTLGLYVTAKEAYERWEAAPDKVKIIDVRTPEEVMWVGHPPMAWKIPVVAVTYEWDADKKQFPMRPLPDFVARVQKVAKPDDTLMVMCRSGGRGAMAVNLLAKAGYKNVYNVIDGMEGDSVDGSRTACSRASGS